MPAGWRLNSFIVVDNASTDDSLALLGESTTPVNVIRNTSNRGFGAACNQGARASAADILLFLNPDTRLFKDSLSVTLRRLQQGEKEGIGIVGAQLIDEAGHVSRSCARFPMPHHFLCQAIGLTRLWPRLGQTMLEWGHDSSREVGQVIGAFFMMPRRLFDALDGFDERFFVYFEEVDFANRAAQKGWRSFFVAEAQAFHLGGGSSRKVLDRRLMYSMRSRLLYAHKHFSRLGYVVTWFVTLMLEPPIRILHAFVSGGIEGARAACRGYVLLARSWLAGNRVQP